jgi:DNA-directed RNA polymerase subunit K/omega
MFLAEDYYGKSKNIYEAIMVIARRARQVGERQRREMDAYLNQVEAMEKFEDEESGMIEDAPEVHEPVLQFEKPTVLSLREMIADKIEIKRPEEEQVNQDLPTPEADLPGSFPSKLSLLDQLGDEDEGL